MFGVVVWCYGAVCGTVVCYGVAWLRGSGVAVFSCCDAIVVWCGLWTMLV